MGSYPSAARYQLRRGEVRIRTNQMRDVVNIMWDELTANEMKWLSQNAYAANYRWAISDYGGEEVVRRLSDHYASTTSFLQHFRLKRLMDCDSLILSAEQASGLKRIVARCTAIYYSDEVKSDIRKKRKSPEQALETSSVTRK